MQYLVPSSLPSYAFVPKLICQRCFRDERLVPKLKLPMKVLTDVNYLMLIYCCLEGLFRSSLRRDESFAVKRDIVSTTNTESKKAIRSDVHM